MQIFDHQKSKAPGDEVQDDGLIGIELPINSGDNPFIVRIHDPDDFRIAGFDRCPQIPLGKKGEKEEKRQERQYPGILILTDIRPAIPPLHAN
jgi:hypothetical protein